MIDVDRSPFGPGQAGAAAGEELAGADALAD